MARELHRLRDKELYAIYSTIVDNYITDFLPKEQIKDIWLNDLIEDAKEKVERYMNEVDEVVTETEVKQILEGDPNE